MNQIVHTLLLPPALPLLVALVGLLMFLARRRAGAYVLGLGVLASYALSMPVVSALLIGGLQRQPPVTAEQIAEFEPQRIVVLGSGKDLQRPEWGGETLSAYSLDRLRYGVRLSRETDLPLLVSGGLSGEIGKPEADLMRATVREEYGIQQVIAENTSENTRQNAVNSARALRVSNATRILLVTHAAHMRRAKASFEREGVQVLAAPMGYFNDHIDWADPWLWFPSLEAMQANYYALYERLGWIWYDWQGWVVEDPWAY